MQPGMEVGVHPRARVPTGKVSVKAPGCVCVDTLEEPDLLRQ